jgi:hypothetical protein
VGFVLDKVAVVQVLLQVIRFPLSISIIPVTHHSHSATTTITTKILKLTMLLNNTSKIKVSEKNENTRFMK